MRYAARMALLVMTVTAAVSLTACTAKSPYPGFSTPRATLDTFFASAQRLDYATTYGCYYQPYRERVTEQEFVSHRAQASTLTSYRVSSLTTNGSSAEASVALTFAPTARSNGKSRTVIVHEDLVNQGGAWKIKVW